jgi:hypothetical protein
MGVQKLISFGKQVTIFVGVINLVKEEGRESNGEGERRMEEGEGGREEWMREKERER